MAENKTPEFEPPQACVQRVIKAVLPDNVQIGKDAKAAFSRSAGIFIMYLTACANDFCREAKRQTISAQDVMQAIKELEFGELEEPLKEYLDQYRREANAKKQSKALGAMAGSTPKKEGTGDVDEPDADADAEGETEGVINEDAEAGEREAGDSLQTATPSAAVALGAVAAPVQPNMHPSPAVTAATMIGVTAVGPVAMDEDGGNGGVAGVVTPLVQAAVGAGESNMVG